jgi:hypothetical protein
LPALWTPVASEASHQLQSCSSRQNHGRFWGASMRWLDFFRNETRSKASGVLSQIWECGKLRRVMVESNHGNNPSPSPESRQTDGRWIGQKSLVEMKAQSTKECRFHVEGSIVAFAGGVYWKASPLQKALSYGGKDSSDLVVSIETSWHLIYIHICHQRVKEHHLFDWLHVCVHHKARVGSHGSYKCTYPVLVWYCILLFTGPTKLLLYFHENT